jgi:hypothetical protein
VLSRTLVFVRWGGVLLTLVAIVAQLKNVADAGALNIVIIGGLVLSLLYRWIGNARAGARPIW